MQIPKYVLCCHYLGHAPIIQSFNSKKAAEEMAEYLTKNIYSAQYTVIEDAPEETEPKYISKNDFYNPFPECGNCMSCSQCVTLC